MIHECRCVPLSYQFNGETTYICIHYLPCFQKLMKSRDKKKFDSESCNHQNKYVIEQVLEQLEKKRYSTPNSQKLEHM